MYKERIPTWLVGTYNTWTPWSRERNISDPNKLARHTDPPADTSVALNELIQLPTPILDIHLTQQPDRPPESTVHAQCESRLTMAMWTLFSGTHAPKRDDNCHRTHIPMQHDKHHRDMRVPHITHSTPTRNHDTAGNPTSQMNSMGYQTCEIWE